MNVCFFDNELSYLPLTYLVFVLIDLVVDSSAVLWKYTNTCSMRCFFFINSSHRCVDVTHINITNVYFSSRA